LEKGQRVTVTHGPLRGLEGLVQRTKGRLRVVVNVDMIQQSVAVEIDSRDLVPA
jgi:transcription antitermination factor NusG